MNQEQVRNILAASRRLSQTDPESAFVDEFVQSLHDRIASISGSPNHSAPTQSSGVDANFLKEQVSKLQQAAEIPSQNYLRIVEITKGLSRAAQACERPQYAALRPRIATIIEKVAGIFSEVDTTQDLDKPLAAIEKAVHSLYGDQSKNSTFYFDRRGKGHQTKSE